eukprot:jgi/Ulvmu1/6113/UM027_0091.1
MTEPTDAAPPPAAAAEAPSKEQAPIFGAGINSGGGFAAFSGGAAAPSKDDAGAEEAHEEEECKAEFAPLVQLEEVEKTTGEENEDLLLELKCKMYRFDKDSNEWKERGVGQAKFLKSKETQKIRFVMRQEKTLKIRSNHIVVPGTKISTHGGNDKAWVWSALDFADGEQKMEMLAIRFGTAEKANEFKEQYEKAMDENAPLLADAPAASLPADPPKDAEAEAAVDELADKVAATKVDDAADKDA